MMSGPYPEHCSYQLTAMCTQKNVPQKTKSSESNMLTSKKEVYETFEVFLVDKSSTRKNGREFSASNLVSTFLFSLLFSLLSTTKYCCPKTIRQINAVNWLNYLHSKIYSRFLFFYCFFTCMLLSMFMLNFCNINYSIFYLAPSFSMQNTQFLQLVSLNNSLNISKIQMGFTL